MDNNQYNKALEIFKANLIETASGMGLDVEYFKQVIIADEYCMSFFSTDIAKMMLEIV